MGKAAPKISSALKDDPVEFTRALLTNSLGEPAEPHPAQIEMMQGRKKLTVCRCGRQLGKSVWLGWYIVWFAVTHPNREVYIIAPTVDQSRIIFNECARQFRSPNPLASLVIGKIKEYPFPEIRLANGSKIHGRGANNPQFIRGKPLHLAVLDEAAFFKDGVISTVIEPMLTVTGRLPGSGLIMISTPFGLGDFHDYDAKARKMQAAGKDAAAFHFTSYDNPYADREYLEEVKDTYGEDSLLWRSEYMGEFVDGDLQVFPWSQIKWALENHPSADEKNPVPFPMQPERNHRYIQGVDLANVRDYFVSTILDVTDRNRIPLVRYDRDQKKGYTYYKSVIRDNNRRFNNARTIVDATSLGESVVEDLRDANAEGYKIGGNERKHEIVEELRRMFAERRLTLPNDRAIIDELRYFEYKLTPSKNLKMEAVRGHDDIVMSLALAAHLACIPSVVGWFRGVGGDKSEPEQPQKKKPIKPVFDPIRAWFDEEYELEHASS